MFNNNAITIGFAALALGHLALCAVMRFGFKRDLQQVIWLKALSALVILLPIFALAVVLMDKNPSAGPTYRNSPLGLMIVLLIAGSYLWFVRSLSPAVFAGGEIAIAMGSAAAIGFGATADQLVNAVAYMGALYMYVQGLHELDSRLDGKLVKFLIKKDANREPPQPPPHAGNDSSEAPKIVPPTPPGPIVVAVPTV